MNRRTYIFTRLLCLAILSILALPLLGVSGFAKEALPLPSQPLPVAVSPHSQQGPTDSKELEAFIDQFFSKYEAEQIPGKVFILVKDGDIFFSKGYGYANAEQQIPVIPDKTLFRVASLSKLFTATAVMQLAEQGKLQLNDDINRYLKQFQIENNDFKPITFAHLLTHTDGFDVAWTIGAATRCQSPLPSLEQFLSQNLPQRVHPAGELYVYGDAGMALAGYFVEVLSGIPFAQYINQHILQPLDMHHSSFLQPLPLELATNLAVGYEDKNGANQRTPFTCAKSVPSIALSATATDMAHFMIAHLQGGHYGKTQLLTETTVREMHRQHFTNFPTIAQAAGSAYGFYERFQNHQRAIEHGGSMYGYTSQLFLMPEQNLGFFVAYNKENKVELRENLIEQFLDHYYPEPKNDQNKSQVQECKSQLMGTSHQNCQQWSSSEFQRQTQKLNGNYRFIRYPQHSFAKLWVVLFGPRPDLRLKSHSDGTFTLLPVRTRWVQVEPLVFRYRNGRSYLRFRQDNQGQITNMSLSKYVFVTYEKLLWYETIDFQQGLLGFCVVMFLSACCIWPINPLIRRWRSKTFQVSRFTRLMQFLLGAIGILNLSFLIGMLLIALQTNYWEFFFGMSPITIALLYLPILTTGLTVGLPIVVWLAWQDKHWSVMQRIHHFLITLAAGMFILLLDYWNLLGFQF